jgi:GNAT superfamily N-acetyltransferase
MKHRSRRNPEPVPVPPLEVYAAGEIAAARDAEVEVKRTLDAWGEGAEADSDALAKAFDKAMVAKARAARKLAARRQAWKEEVATGGIEPWIEDRGPDGFVVRYERGDLSGVVHCREFPIDLLPRCRGDLRRAAARLQRGDLRFFYVHQSGLSPELQGTGLGTRLYVMAARAAARRGAVLAPDWCRQGGTTHEAWRVWKGGGFRSQVAGFGDIVWGGGLPPRKRPSRSAAASRTNPHRRHR